MENALFRFSTEKSSFFLIATIIDKKGLFMNEGFYLKFLLYLCIETFKFSLQLKREINLEIILLFYICHVQGFPTLI